MILQTGFETEDFKYIYGERDKRAVPFDTKKTIEQVIGKNDWSSVQLLLYSEEEMMVSMTGEAAFHYSGPMDQVRMEATTVEDIGVKLRCQLVGLMRDDDTLYKSDTLLNQSSIHVKQRQVQQVLMTLETDKDCKPGKYPVNIRLFSKNMFEDEVLVKELSYEVEVLDYCLKDASDNEFYLDLWQHNSNIARKYDVPLWSDEHFNYIDGYVKSLAELGQKAISLIVSEIPWSGQGSVYDLINDSDLYEYNMVAIKRTVDQQWTYDFSTIKKYIELCMSYGIKEEIEIFGLSNIWLYESFGFGKVIENYADGIRLRYYDEKDGMYKFIRDTKSLGEYIKALDQFFSDNGWSGKVRVLADEPAELDVFKEKVKELNELAPGMKFKVAINHVEFMGEDIPNVTDFCPFIECITKKYDEFKAMKSNVKGRLSYYVCCGPLHPNTFIASPLVESRLIPWAAKHLKIDGFLRWNYTVWPKDPLNDITYRYPVWPAGDTNFVYPGRDGQPILSLRYMGLKRGIRDFQIMLDYEKKMGDSAAITDILNDVIYNEEFLKIKGSREELYCLDYSRYESHISQLLAKLAN